MIRCGNKNAHAVTHSYHASVGLVRSCFATFTATNPSPYLAADIEWAAGWYRSQGMESTANYVARVRTQDSTITYTS